MWGSHKVPGPPKPHNPRTTARVRGLSPHLFPQAQQAAPEAHSPGDGPHLAQSACPTQPGAFMHRDVSDDISGNKEREKQSDIRMTVAVGSATIRKPASPRVHLLGLSHTDLRCGWRRTQLAGRRADRKIQWPLRPTPCSPSQAHPDTTLSPSALPSAAHQHWQTDHHGRCLMGHFPIYN